ncbi:putative nuclease [Sulfolobales Beppu filamentous virus 2]|uniref:Putative nuclease n=1 Tax=Sulfolobales Beppu filamentous virus 2 TaxID=2493123 RepID=A0A3Q8Q3P8_9VIRU|nr:putative nuclease [Sulfolobales Beppu filamentous virus 2]AZI75775.1 putative nuclease [Sulfolobales Beppu filamentous virus 2]
MVLVAEQKVIKLEFETGSYSHTLKHSVLYSVKRNKFVKGFCHKGTRWRCEYRVFPGVYIVWSVSGFKDSRGLVFTIRKVKVGEDGSMSNVEIMFNDSLLLDDLLKMRDDPNAPGSLRLFINSIPIAYHTVGSIPSSDVTFDADEVQRVITYVTTYLIKTAED